MEDTIDRIWIWWWDSICIPHPQTSSPSCYYVLWPTAVRTSALLFPLGDRRVESVIFLRHLFPTSRKLSRHQQLRFLLFHPFFRHLPSSDSFSIWEWWSWIMKLRIVWVEKSTAIYLVCPSSGQIYTSFSCYCYCYCYVDRAATSRKLIDGDTSKQFPRRRFFSLKDVPFILKFHDRNHYHTPALPWILRYDVSPWERRGSDKVSYLWQQISRLLNVAL